MAASITITGVPPYDGVYPLDLEEAFFTNAELREIKLMTGVRGGELMDAIDAGDNDIVVAFATIAVRRSGVSINPAALWNATAGSIQFDTDAATLAEGEESLPPQSELGKSESGSELTPLSGETSEPPTDLSPPTLTLTGTPDSVTGAESGLTTLAV